MTCRIVVEEKLKTLQEIDCWLVERIGELFGDTQRMEDIGNFAASIVNGIGDWLNNVTYDDWNTIFNGIAVAMTTFFENVDWERVFAGIYNAFSTLGQVIADQLEIFWDSFLPEGVEWGDVTLPGFGV